MATLTMGEVGVTYLPVSCISHPVPVTQLDQGASCIRLNM
jgi:hypothetical protein